MLLESHISSVSWFASHQVGHSEYLLYCTELRQVGEVCVLRQRVGPHLDISRLLSLRTLRHRQLVDVYGQRVRSLGGLSTNRQRLPCHLLTDQLGRSALSLQLTGEADLSSTLVTLRGKHLHILGRDLELQDAPQEGGDVVREPPRGKSTDDNAPLLLPSTQFNLKNAPQRLHSGLRQLWISESSEHLPTTEGGPHRQAAEYLQLRSNICNHVVLREPVIWKSRDLHVGGLARVRGAVLSKVTALSAREATQRRHEGSRVRVPQETLGFRTQAPLLTSSPCLINIPTSQVKIETICTLTLPREAADEACWVGGNIPAIGVLASAVELPAIAFVAAHLPVRALDLPHCRPQILCEVFRNRRHGRRSGCQGRS
mmetsp:Transcript_29502/g.78026  ORF Transcript_29502/g.78026 Transcript_29502/m.78026 type:complete len:371 (+) Transcript_29502:967-2079(+)